MGRLQLIFRPPPIYFWRRYAHAVTLRRVEDKRRQLQYGQIY
jgi:hypothetical protein